MKPSLLVVAVLSVLWSTHAVAAKRPCYDLLRTQSDRPVEEISREDLESFSSKNYVATFPYVYEGVVTFEWLTPKGRVRSKSLIRAAVVGRFKDAQNEKQVLVRIHTPRGTRHYAIREESIVYFRWGIGQFSRPITKLRKLTPGRYVRLDYPGDGKSVAGRFVKLEGTQVTLSIRGENRVFDVTRFDHRIWLGSKLPSVTWLKQQRKRI